MAGQPSPSRHRADNDSCHALSSHGARLAHLLEVDLRDEVDRALRMFSMLSDMPRLSDEKGCGDGEPGGGTKGGEEEGLETRNPETRAFAVPPKSPFAPSLSSSSGRGSTGQNDDGVASDAGPEDTTGTTGVERRASNMEKVMYPRPSALPEPVAKVLLDIAVATDMLGVDVETQVDPPDSPSSQQVQIASMHACRKGIMTMSRAFLKWRRWVTAKRFYKAGMREGKQTHLSVMPEMFFGWWRARARSNKTKRMARIAMALCRWRAIVSCDRERRINLRLDRVAGENARARALAAADRAMLLRLKSKMLRVWRGRVRAINVARTAATAMGSRRERERCRGALLIWKKKSEKAKHRMAMKGLVEEMRVMRAELTSRAEELAMKAADAEQKRRTVVAQTQVKEYFVAWIGQIRRLRREAIQKSKQRKMLAKLFTISQGRYSLTIAWRDWMIVARHQAKRRQRRGWIFAHLARFRLRQVYITLRARIAQSKSARGAIRRMCIFRLRVQFCHWRMWTNVWRRRASLNDAKVVRINRRRVRNAFIKWNRLRIYIEILRPSMEVRSRRVYFIRWARRATERLMARVKRGFAEVYQSQRALSRGFVEWVRFMIYKTEIRERKRERDLKRIQDRIKDGIERNQKENLSPPNDNQPKNREKNETDGIITESSRTAGDSNLAKKVYSKGMEPTLSAADVKTVLNVSSFSDPLVEMMLEHNSRKPENSALRVVLDTLKPFPRKAAPTPVATGAETLRKKFEASLRRQGIKVVPERWQKKVGDLSVPGRKSGNESGPEITSEAFHGPVSPGKPMVSTIDDEENDDLTAVDVAAVKALGSLDAHMAIMQSRSTASRTAVKLGLFDTRLAGAVRAHYGADLDPHGAAPPRHISNPQTLTTLKERFESSQAQGSREAKHAATLEVANRLLKESTQEMGRQRPWYGYTMKPQSEISGSSIRTSSDNDSQWTGDTSTEYTDGYDSGSPVKSSHDSYLENSQKIVEGGPGPKRKERLDSLDDAAVHSLPPSGAASRMITDAAERPPSPYGRDLPEDATQNGKQDSWNEAIAESGANTPTEAASRVMTEGHISRAISPGSIDMNQGTRANLLRDDSPTPAASRVLTENPTSRPLSPQSRDLQRDGVRTSDPTLIVDDTSTKNRSASPGDDAPRGTAEANSAVPTTVPSRVTSLGEALTRAPSPEGGIQGGDRRREYRNSVDPPTEAPSRENEAAWPRPDSPGMQSPPAADVRERAGADGSDRAKSETPTTWWPRETPPVSSPDAKLPTQPGQQPNEGPRPLPPIPPKPEQLTEMMLQRRLQEVELERKGTEGREGPGRNLDDRTSGRLSSRGEDVMSRITTPSSYPIPSYPPTMAHSVSEQEPERHSRGSAVPLNGGRVNSSTGSGLGPVADSAPHSEYGTHKAPGGRVTREAIDRNDADVGKERSRISDERKKQRRKRRSHRSPSERRVNDRKQDEIRVGDRLARRGVKAALSELQVEQTALRQLISSMKMPPPQSVFPLASRAPEGHQEPFLSVPSQHVSQEAGPIFGGLLPKNTNSPHQDVALSPSQDLRLQVSPSRHGARLGLTFANDAATSTEDLSQTPHKPAQQAMPNPFLQERVVPRNTKPPSPLMFEGREVPPSEGYLSLRPSLQTPSFVHAAPKAPNSPEIKFSPDNARVLDGFVARVLGTPSGDQRPVQPHFTPVKGPGSIQASPVVLSGQAEQQIRKPEASARMKQGDLPQEAPPPQVAQSYLSGPFVRRRPSQSPGDSPKRPRGDGVRLFQGMTRPTFVAKDVDDTPMRARSRGGFHSSEQYRPDIKMGHVTLKHRLGQWKKTTRRRLYLARAMQPRGKEILSPTRTAYSASTSAFHRDGVPPKRPIAQAMELPGYAEMPGMF